MLRDLTIQNFRGFESLHLADLGRVNLIVGANNSGKTSVLEAVHLLMSGGDVAALWAALSRRGELAAFSDRESQDDIGVEVRHIFHGHTIENDPQLRVAATLPSGQCLECVVSTVPARDDQSLRQWRESLARPRRRQRARPEPPDETLFDRGDRIPRFLQVKSPDGVEMRAILTLGGALLEEDAALSRPKAPLPVHFITTASLSHNRLARLYDDVALTKEEPHIISALNAVDDGVMRIAAVDVGSQRFTRERSIKVDLRGAPEPVPLGSLGDGMHRILSIALSLAAAKGGYLLIDEIDTGLHHTVMRKMWRLVHETAERLDVSVFSTTHSYDCVHALSAIARDTAREGGGVSLLRVEANRPEAVHFSEAEIIRLAQRDIEPR